MCPRSLHRAQTIRPSSGGGAAMMGGFGRNLQSNAQEWRALGAADLVVGTLMEAFPCAQ